MKKLILGSVMGLLTVAVTAQSYKPAVKLEAGKRYAVNSTMKGLMTQEAMGQTMEIPIENNTYSTMEIKAADANGYKAITTADRLVFFMSMMGQDMRYDSDKKEDRDGKMGETMNNLVNVTTSFSVDNDGKVVPGSLIKSAAKEQSGVDDMMSSMMNGMGGQQGGATSAFNLFPSATELKIGDSFTDSSSVNNEKEGKVKTTNQYKLVEVKDGIAKFDINGTTSVERKAEMQGMELVVITSAKNTGTMLVNTTTGLLEKRTIIIETTGNVEAQGMQIPITGKMTVETTVASK